jgi:hypothetical protein
VAVIEVGAILDGLPVFRIDFHQEVKGDAALRSGLFSAIQSFAKEAFGDETEELRLKNLTICMKTVNVEGRDVALYAVADRDTRSIDPVRSALQKIGTKLIEIGQKQKINTLEPNKNAFLRPIFDEYFKDLRMRPEERARRLFG